MKYFQLPFKKKGTRISIERNIPDTTISIEKQKQTIEQYNKRIAFLTSNIKTLENEAKEAIKEGDQRGARFALQRKKIMDNQINQMINLRLTLENQVQTMEMHRLQHEGVVTLQEAVSVQRNSINNIDIGALDEMVAEMQEQRDMQAEMFQIISSNNSFESLEDIEKEMEKLEKEQALEAQEKLTMQSPPLASTNVKLPPLMHNAPNLGTQNSSSSHTSRQNKKSDEDQLNELLSDLI